MNSSRSAVIAILFGLTLSLHAGVGPLITSPGTGEIHHIDPGTVGALFQVGAQPLQVTSLGLFDEAAPGLTQSHSVGLWTVSGTLLARIDFEPGLNGASSGGYLYQMLSAPVNLQPGFRYVLGANYQANTTDGYPVNGSLESETWSSSVSFIAGRYTLPDATFTFPNFQVGGLSYAGFNALFVVIPEPGTPALLMASVAALVLWLRSRPPKRGSTDHRALPVSTISIREGLRVAFNAARNG